MSNTNVPITNFPEDAEEDLSDRRSFVGVVATLAGACYAGALGYPVYKYLASPSDQSAGESAISQVTLPDANKLPVESAMMFKFGSKPALLIHHSDGSWVALSAVCTHLGCTVQFQPEQKRIHCACHGGVYDPVTGKNVSGPPPRPLAAYKVAVSDKGVTVSLS